MNYLFTPYAKLKGRKAKQERDDKRMRMVKQTGEAFANLGRKLGATNIIEKMEDAGQSLASKAFRMVGYEEGGVIDGLKRGGVVKKKKGKAKKIIKQKVKQHVSQKVIVNVSNPRPRRRAGGGRKKKAIEHSANAGLYTGHLGNPMSENYKLYEQENERINARPLSLDGPHIEELLDEQKNQQEKYLQLMGQQQEDNKQRQQDLTNLIQQGGNLIMQKLTSAPTKLLTGLKKRGRPVGSKNKTKEVDPNIELSPLKTRGQKEQQGGASAVPPPPSPVPVQVPQKKKGRGRPKKIIILPDTEEVA